MLPLHPPCSWAAPGPITRGRVGARPQSACAAPCVCWWLCAFPAPSPLSLPLPGLAPARRPLAER